MSTMVKSQGMTREQELVLELVQFRNPNNEKIMSLFKERLDLAEVLGHLSYNRVAGIAYHTLRKIDAPFINREFELSISLIHDIQSHRTASHRKSIISISEGLRMKNIPHAFLKGSILANSIYPSGCRISSDIDILLRTEDLTACGDVLRAMGFVQGDYDDNTKQIKPASRREIINYRVNYGEVKPYLRTTNEPGIRLIEVDLNFSLDWLASGTEQAVDNFIRNSEDYPFEGGYTVSSLAREYFLAHLCVHLFKEAAVLNWVDWQRDLGLYKFVDIYAFLTDPGIAIDWEKLIAVMEENDIVEECYYSFDYTRTFFPSLCAQEPFMAMMARIQPKDTDYLNHVVDPANSAVKYQWKKTLIDRFFDMKRYESLEKVT